VVVIGKAMGNGYPVAGVITTRALADAFAQGPLYFNTFGGNNVACASGLAVLMAIKENNLQANAEKVGDYLLERLQELKRLTPSIVGDVRGCGLFIGVDIIRCPRSKTPSPGRARWIMENMNAKRVCFPHKSSA
jgi:ethanolamine-phosphate phospho-lyase